MYPGDLGPEIERLPGVLAATVFADARSGPRVYLAVEPDTDRDALRATTLALLRDHDLTTDPDRLHIGIAPATPPAPTALPPLTLDGLEVHRTDNRVDCTIRLRAGGRTLTASATEPDTPPGRARATARAVLAATETLDPDLRLGLHGARVHGLFGFDAVSVLVEATVGRTHIQLPAAALVDRSIEHAAAIAALQALRTWVP